MSDSFLDLANNKLIKNSLKKVGIRLPQILNRDFRAYRQDMFVSSKMAVLGSGPLNKSICSFATKYSVNLTCLDVNKANVPNYEALKYDDKLKALIFDACDLDLRNGLDILYKFFNVYSSMMEKCGRVIIISSNRDAILNESLSGFMKSLSKELGGLGVSVNQLIIAKEALSDDMELDSILSFFCSDKAAYITGQCIFINQTSNSKPLVKALHGKTCLVTGASRGIGLAICEAFADEGAEVIGVDLPFLEEKLSKEMNRIGGRAYTLDITDRSKYEDLVKYISSHSKIDILIQNAGVTRDGVFKRLKYQKWIQALDVNLFALMDLTQALTPCFAKEMKIVCLSSIAGLAGNFGQTNYAASKAGVKAFVKEYASENPDLIINAVAPGFIETEMTAKVPFLVRFFARRLSSLNQGGLPSDVADLCVFLSAQNNINGQTIRCCGGNLIG